METDSSLHQALGRLEGKVETLLSLQTSHSEKAARTEAVVSSNSSRIAALEAKVDTRSDGSRFWLVTSVSVFSAVAAIGTLVKEIIFK